MKQSPFVYGSTVSKKSFTNRGKDIEKLYNNLTQGINTMIVSPRRWGKSSLVEKVLYEIENNEKNIKTVVIDLFSIAGEEEFLEVFASEIIKASSSKAEEWLQAGKDFFKRLIPKINIGIDPVNDFSLSFDWEELVRHKDEILNLPEMVAVKKNIRFIIALDEFQNLATYKQYNTLEKNMRAVWQRHKHVAYCLYGSKRSMMTDIFNNPSKPFYRFGDMMLLTKIDTEHWVKFIARGFRETGKIISDEMALKISLIMKNHSWYVQQFAHYTWQKTEIKVGKKEIMSALFELIHANSPFFEKEIETTSYTQINLLKAIVQGEKHLTSTRVMQLYKLGTPNNVSKNKAVLINRDIINFSRNYYEFLDPVFELWFLKRFYKKEYVFHF